MNENGILKTYADTLPDRSFCTDELGPMRVQPQAVAIKKKYIQSNSKNDLKWLAYDIDRNTAFYDWYEMDAPAPNIIALNKDNGHCHHFYGLETPVFSQPAMRNSKAYRYAASIDVGLTVKLDADRSYGKLIQKNPLHEHWHVETFQESPYTLGWLADWLDLDPYSDQRKRLPEIGLGRNCTLFERARRWSYRNIRKEWLNYEMWEWAVRERVKSYNDFFDVPLPNSETRSVARSVARWVWTNMSYEGFLKWGDARRQRSLEVREQKMADKMKIMIELMQMRPGITQKDLASFLGMTQQNISYYMSKLSKYKYVISDDTTYHVSWKPFSLSLMGDAAVIVDDVAFNLNQVST